MKLKVFFLLSIVLLFTKNSYSQTIIEMEQKDGVYYVPCKINEVPMKFIFDTGASNVSISITEAIFLIKHGGLNIKNIKESTKYKIANGSIQEGTRVIIPSIKIGSVELKNVEAGVVHNMKAPLLLGQSAISKLGKFQIDKNKLILYKNFKEPKNEFLNINVEKEFDDYDFDISLDEFIKLSDTKDLIDTKGVVDTKGVINYEFDLKKLSTKNENHYLSTFDFNNQYALFERTGKLLVISLVKISEDVDSDYLQIKELINNSVDAKKEAENVYNDAVWNTWENDFYTVSLRKKDNQIGLVCLNKKTTTYKINYFKNTNYFLNIDFSKKFDSFGSNYTLEELILWAKRNEKIDEDGIINKKFDIKEINEDSEKNFLSHIDFDEELIKFHRSGMIHLIELKKKTENPQRLFLNIKKLIENRYGKFNRITDKTISWTTNKNYFIYLSKTDEHIFVVCINYICRLPLIRTVN